MVNPAIKLREKPSADTTYMLVGWRQWADAGSISSGLPRYLLQETNARRIGHIDPDGFYMFQFPGTHDLIRPIVRFENGYPEELDTQSNDIYYTELDGNGIVYFIGDEPHLDVERYTNTLLDLAKELNVSRIVGFGGVYAEVPYNKERSVSATYSNRLLKPALDKLSVTYSDYNGGASIGSVLSRRAADRNVDYVSFYSFVPNYDLSRFTDLDNAIRLENDFMAWVGIMRRVNYFLDTQFDLTELELKCGKLIQVLDDKIEELDASAPTANIYQYFEALELAFDENVFDPLDDVWEDELRRLLDESDSTEA